MVVSLEASNDFLKERVINLPQSKVFGTHNTEEGMLHWNHYQYNWTACVTVWTWYMCAFCVCINCETAYIYLWSLSQINLLYWLHVHMHVQVQRISYTTHTLALTQQWMNVCVLQWFCSQSCVLLFEQWTHTILCLLQLRLTTKTETVPWAKRGRHHCIELLWWVWDSSNDYQWVCTSPHTHTREERVGGGGEGV